MENCDLSKFANWIWIMEINNCVIIYVLSLSFYTKISFYSVENVNSTPNQQSTKIIIINNQSINYIKQTLTFLINIKFKIFSS